MLAAWLDCGCSQASLARLELPERESNVGSTPDIASAKAPPPAMAAALNPGPALDAVHEFGRYHDLRLSGVLVWCRLCGRFGAERIQRGRGLGGDCLVALKGPKFRTHTQLNLLRDGLHPRTKEPLPPELPFVR